MLWNSASCQNTKRERNTLSCQWHKIKTAILESQEDSSVDPYFFQASYLSHAFEDFARIRHILSNMTFTYGQFEILIYVGMNFSQISNFWIYEKFERICHTCDRFFRTRHMTQIRGRIFRRVIVTIEFVTRVENS